VFHEWYLIPGLLLHHRIVAGGPVRPRSVAGIAMEMFEQHQGTHILQVCCLHMITIHHVLNGLLRYKTRSSGFWRRGAPC